MIYYDPTEAREGTLLSQSVIQSGKPLANLETLTGGDILITPSPIPGNSIDSAAGRKIFENIIGRSFLIQRKSGMDMLQSIPHLMDVLRRMREWDSMPWLAVSGDFYTDSTLKVICNDHKTNWHYHSYKGVLDAWQIAGGRYHSESTDDDLGDWILSLEEKVKKIAENPDWFTHREADKAHLKHDPRPWRAVLEGFPGVGAELSTRIADYCGNLANSLLWMTSVNQKGVKGVGTPTKLKWNAFCDLDPDECLAPIENDDSAWGRWRDTIREVGKMEDIKTIDDLFERIDEVKS
jgi:ERCC4-type nuclease